MVDAQRENHLGLHVDAFLIDAGVDEDGRQLIAFAAFERLWTSRVIGSLRQSPSCSGGMTT